MDYLDELESMSIYIIREAFARFDKIAMLWSAGKDSTTLVWLCKKAFFGRVPFPVVYIDTGLHIRQMYEFRDMCVKRWGLDLIVSHNYEEAERLGVGAQDKLRCCDVRKTQALKKTMAEYGFEAILLGIRRDEHGIRAKERVFSPRSRDFVWDYRNQPPEMWDQFNVRTEEEGHLRVHPLLHWRELDIWLYLEREGLPVNPLYFAKGGKRYRSLGCAPCTVPVESEAATIGEIIEEIRVSKTDERSGRAQDKERAYAMQKLRALGYM